MEHEGDNYTNCDWCFWHVNSRIIKGPGRFRSWRPSGDHPNNSIIENDQNTEKSPGDLRRLAVTQTPVKDHQLTLMWKTLMSDNNNNNNNNRSAFLSEVCCVFSILYSWMLYINTHFVCHFLCTYTQMSIWISLSFTPWFHLFGRCMQTV